MTNINPLVYLKKKCKTSWLLKINESQMNAFMQHLTLQSDNFGDYESENFSLIVLNVARDIFIKLK